MANGTGTTATTTASTKTSKRTNQKRGERASAVAAELQSLRTVCSEEIDSIKFSMFELGNQRTDYFFLKYILPTEKAFIPALGLRRPGSSE